MFASIVLLLVAAVCGFFTAVLLIRVLMQWQRVSFRNPLGQFIIAASDWVVRPFRRVVPGWMGIDFASLLPAWGFQAIQLMVELLIGHASGSVLLPLAVSLGLVELLRFALYLLMVLVFASAIMSWVSPHAPAAPLVNAMSEPFLRPFRRIVPMLGGVDLSPMVLLLVLQIGVMIVGHLRSAVIMGLLV